MIHERDDYNRIQDPAGLIPEDEPVFLLRGQDITAPILLRLWGEMQALKPGGANRSLQYAAENQAAAMESWQQEHGGKFAVVSQFEF